MSNASIVAFVGGATGYTGRAVVDTLAAEGVHTIAHLRPDSPHKKRWTDRWGASEVRIDSTPWEAVALRATLARLKPTHVFALLGTTRARAQHEGQEAVAAYEAVDYRLTMMLYEAAVACDHSARFIYLSAAGVREQTGHAYMSVRVRVERALREGTLPYTIARPSFITGSGRDESRPAERIGAAVADGLLSALGWVGGAALRDRYHSMDNTTLARGLVRIALDPDFENEVVEAERLRD